MAPTSVYGCVCSKCEIKINRCDDSIKCFNCHCGFHIKCVNISTEVFTDMRVNKSIKQWCCPRCVDLTGREHAEQPAREKPLESIGSLNAYEYDPNSGEETGDVSKKPEDDLKLPVRPSADRVSDTYDGQECVNLQCVKCALQCGFLRKENLLLRQSLEQAHKRLIDQEEIIRLLKNRAINQSSSINHSKFKKVKVGESIKSAKLSRAVSSHADVVFCGDATGDKDGDVTNSVDVNPIVSVDLNGGSSVSATVIKPDRMRTVTFENDMSLSLPSTETKISDGDLVGGGVDAEYGIKSKLGDSRNVNVNVIIGSNDGTGKVSAVERLGYLFVYRLGPNITEEELDEYLKNVAPTINFRSTLVKKSDLSTSFRVSFPLSHVDEVYEPGIWPKGAAVRRYFFRRNDGNFQKRATVAAV